MMYADLKTCPCPACGGIGMMHPDHPHAFGHKDYERVRCCKRVKCGKTYDRFKYEEWLKKREARSDNK